MITIDMKMPTDCNSCLIRKIMGCKISNESGWLNNRRDERCLLKDVVRCKDCKNWIPGHITDQDDFIPPKCGKYQQMVGHSNDDFCSLAEKKEGR